MWDEAMAILDTMRWNMDKTEGGIGRYTQDSEDDTIAVSMSVRGSARGDEMTNNWICITKRGG